MNDVRARVEAAVERFARDVAPWQPGDTVIAAVSGGPDSLCLLGALLALRSQWPALAPGRIVVAHLDHGLRGEVGAADAAWMATFAATLGLECVLGTEDVAALAQRERRSLEDAARNVRYAFLRRVAAERGASRICVGHTRDDQSETLIMHWLRGSGLTGLSGMRSRAGDVARPLLAISRADTVAYCAARGWEPRHDATNDDLAFLRNRIRQKLLPTLELYNPNLRETLLREAEIFREDDRYLEEQAAELWQVAVTAETQYDLRLAAPALRGASAALRRRVVRRATAHVSPDGTGAEAKHILAVEALLTRGRTGASLNLPGRLRVTLEYDTLSFERLPSTSTARPTPPSTAEKGQATAALAVPGSLSLPEIGWRLTASIEPEMSSPYTWHPRASRQVVDPITGHGLHEEALLDADVAGDVLGVRTWQPGDRIRPLGMAGHKKLQDVFVDGGVPRSLRHRLPLVAGPSHLLWVGGLCLDERARVTPETRRALRLRLEPLVGGNTTGYDHPTIESE